MLLPGRQGKQCTQLSLDWQSMCSLDSSRTRSTRRHLPNPLRPCPLRPCPLGLCPPSLNLNQRRHQQAYCKMCLPGMPAGDRESAQCHAATCHRKSNYKITLISRLPMCTNSAIAAVSSVHASAAAQHSSTAVTTFALLALGPCGHAVECQCTELFQFTEALAV